MCNGMYRYIWVLYASVCLWVCAFERVHMDTRASRVPFVWRELVCKQVTNAYTHSRAYIIYIYIYEEIRGTIRTHACFSLYAICSILIGGGLSILRIRMWQKSDMLCSWPDTWHVCLCSWMSGWSDLIECGRENHQKVSTSCGTYVYCMYVCMYIYIYIYIYACGWNNLAQYEYGQAEICCFMCNMCVCVCVCVSATSEKMFTRCVYVHANHAHTRGWRTWWILF
jgi:hypothetical protein